MVASGLSATVSRRGQIPSRRGEFGNARVRFLRIFQEKLRKAYDGAIQSAVTQFMTLLATKTKD
jgi:hypothetical protein